MGEFLNFYEVSFQTELTIQQVRGTKGKVLFLDLRFRRNFYNCEVNEFQRLLAYFIHNELVDGAEALSWELKNNETFFVKSFYERH